MANMGIWIIAIGVLAVVGLLAFGGTGQTVFTGGNGDGDGTGTGSNVEGRAATLSVGAENVYADNSPDVATEVYVQNPQGEWVIEGENISASGRTDLTDGIVVDTTGEYQIVGFDSTYGSVAGAIGKAITSEAAGLDVEVYEYSDSVDLTLYDENGDSLAASGNNVSLGSGETYNFEKMRIKNSAANKGFYVYGLYLDLVESTNISDVSFNDAELGAEGSMPLRSVTADDYTWMLNAGVMLQEYDYIDLDGFTVEADADGTSGEAYTITVVDGAYFWSNNNDDVEFGAETDASSAVDVGATNPTVSGNFL